MAEDNPPTAKADVAKKNRRWELWNPTGHFQSETGPLLSPYNHPPPNSSPMNSPFPTATTTAVQLNIGMPAAFNQAIPQQSIRADVNTPISLVQRCDGAMSDPPVGLKDRGNGRKDDPGRMIHYAGTEVDHQVRRRFTLLGSLSPDMSENTFISMATAGADRRQGGFGPWGRTASLDENVESENVLGKRKVAPSHTENKSVKKATTTDNEKPFVFARHIGNNLEGAAKFLPLPEGKLTRTAFSLKSLGSHRKMGCDDHEDNDHPTISESVVIPLKTTHQGSATITPRQLPTSFVPTARAAAASGQQENPEEEPDPTEKLYTHVFNLTRMMKAIQEQSNRVHVQQQRYIELLLERLESLSARLQQQELVVQTIWSLHPSFTMNNNTPAPLWHQIQSLSPPLWQSIIASLNNQPAPSSQP